MGGGRLNIERQMEFEPIRMKSVEDELLARGFEPIIISTNEISFLFNGNVIKVFPYSGWHQGKGIKADRGLRKLYAQLEVAISQPTLEKSTEKHG
ncbi:MAG: hypothetical protein EOO88_00320 [Pedobacter sp.]|nr:MAG: hypothetical protein EOO88_00320 [Pedobacter sp.]